MKHEAYQKQLDKIKADVIYDLVTGCLSAGALEIQLYHPLVYRDFDGNQVNEVITRINIEQQVALIDDSFDISSIKLDKLSLDILLNLLQEFEEGNYEIWEVVAE
jgi:hypothetical protein